MKAISIWQPFASLIAGGYLHVEPRIWKPPADFIGKRIALHASKHYNDLVQKAISELWCKHPPNGCGHTKQELPWGALIATGVITRVYDEADQEAREHRLIAKSRPMLQYHLTSRRGAWLWLIEDVRRFKQPIPVRGFLKFWNLDEFEEPRVLNAEIWKDPCD